jgi:peptidoglycan hydrolase-like protein with peptidoglycan-binding domain
VTRRRPAGPAVLRRRLAVPAVLAATATAGAVTAVAVRGGMAAAAPPAAGRLATAAVARTDLATTMLAAGTLGYAPLRPLVNRLSGTYTWLPAAGRTIAPGQVLYRVDNLAVVLMAGSVPAWRPFGLGMTAGPDVAELQRGLIAAGSATGLLTVPTGHFDQVTADAVMRWQTAHGYPATGQIDLGQIVFLPSAVRVGGLATATGEPAGPGQRPYQVSTDERIVTVPVSPDLPPVRVGERVSILLPTNATTPGRVVAFGPVAARSGNPAEQLVVRPVRPAATGSADAVAVQVSLSVQSVRAVLAVPVTALLALRAGQYGVEVVTPSGAHRVVAVRTGIFAGGQVQISGRGLAPGEHVVVSE